MRFCIAFILCGLGSGIFFAAPTMAEPAAQPATSASATPTLPRYSPILPVKIKPRQGGADTMSKAAADVEQDAKVDPDSLGLLKTQAEGALPATLWSGYTDEELSLELSKINLNIQSPVIRSVFVRALITQPDIDKKDENRKSENFSVRLSTLADLGDFDDVFKLYKKLDGNVPSSPAALAGVQSMIGQGRIGLACLENKALDASLKKSDGNGFWPDLDNFCEALLTSDAGQGDDAQFLKSIVSSPAMARKFTAVSTLEALNAKSFVSIVALSGAGRIPADFYSFEAARKLKPAVIALLLKNTELPPAAHLDLIAAAVEKNMVPPSDLDTAYQTYSRAPVGTGEWQTVLDAYAKLQAASGARDKIAAAELGFNKTQGADVRFLPFARLLGALKPTDACPLALADQVVAGLIRLDSPVSGPWAARAFGQPGFESKESLTDLDVVTALQSGFSPSGPTENTPDDDQTVKNKKSDKNQSDTAKSMQTGQLDAVNLLLKSQETEDKVDEKSYEKLFSLTATNDYVMPSKELMNGLRQASDSQDAGKIVLYSLQILNGQRVSQLHPAALLRISEGFRSVGLSDEFRSLAHEVLADLIDRK